MSNPSALLQRKMRGVKISDSDFFMSGTFSNYLRTSISYTCKRFRVPVPIPRIISDESTTAYTDGRDIVISCNGPLLVGTEDRTHKVRLILGECTHELGHILFTNFPLTTKTVNMLRNTGKFYPTMEAKDLEPTLLANRDDAEAYLSCPKSTATETGRRSRVAQLWKDIANIIEDGFIEEELYRCVTGVLIDGLNEKRRIQRETAPSYSDMLKQCNDESHYWPILHNMMLTYVLFGTLSVNWDDPSEVSSEPLQWFIKAKPYIYDALHTPDFKQRMTMYQKVFLALWPVLRIFLNTHEDINEEKMQEITSSFSGTRTPSDSTGFSLPVGSRLRSGDTEGELAREELDKLLDRISECPCTTSNEDAPSPSKSCINFSYDFDPDEFRSDMARLERKLIEETAIREVNCDLERSLLDEASTLNFGDAHRDVKKVVRRHTLVPQSVIDTYNANAAPIEKIAKTMARKVLPVLKKKSKHDMLPMGGFYSGNKFDATRLVTGDMRYFKNNATPMPDTSLAISVLLDESGSMAVNKMNAGKYAALALYLFCQECNIPCCVHGHTASFYDKVIDGIGPVNAGSLIMNSYAEFDSPDNQDKYRILCAKAKEDNRDGAAILYTGKHLLKRKEPIKLMFVISDGQPFAQNYFGQYAEEDTKSVVASLRREGVIIFSMAIDEDKDTTRRIFGDGFIDIKDLSTVPDQLLSLVKRFII